MNVNILPVKTSYQMLLHLGIIAVLLIIDVPLYKSFHAVLDWIYTNNILLLKEITRYRHWEFFKQFGSIWAPITIGVFIWIYDRPKAKSLISLVVSILATTLICEFIRHSVGKMRPTVAEGMVVYLKFPQGWMSNENLAFPSGHSTLAAVLAVWLGCFYPKAKWFFYGLAVACGISRVVLHAHYFSDVYAGLLLGSLCANWIIRSLPYPLGSTGEASIAPPSNQSTQRPSDSKLHILPVHADGDDVVRESVSS